MEGNGLLGKAMHVGERLAEVGGEVAHLKTAASHAVEDAVTEAKRLAKHGRYAAEDLMEDAAHRVKRDPLRSVALGLRPASASARWLYGWRRTRPESSKKRWDEDPSNGGLDTGEDEDLSLRLPTGSEALGVLYVKLAKKVQNPKN
jgi:hypothetical protein